MIDRSEGDIEKIVLNSIKRQLGINTSPDHISIHYARNAIPQYTIGHSARMQQIKKHKNITLLGNSYHGVAVNDCIAEATIAAQSFLF